MCFSILYYFLRFLLLIWLICFVIRIYLKLNTGRCKSNVCLVGKTALITGGNSGIGYQTALGLASRGCKIIIADKEKCDDLQQKITDATGNKNIIVKYLDLASLNSVRKLVKQIYETEEKLDILINNAGTAGLRNCYTEDGLHMGMQVNHFGPFLLTTLLVDLLKKSGPSRIIFVTSSLAHISNLKLQNLNYPKEKPINLWSELMVYANSKLSNIITTNILAKKLRETDVTVNSVHPGMVCTSIYKTCAHRRNLSPIIVRLLYGYFLRYFAKDVEEGAQTTLHVAMSKEVEKVSGKYFADCKVQKKPYKSADKYFAWKIWEESEKLVKLSPQEKL